MTDTSSSTPRWRTGHLIAGWIFVGLGVIGAVLPVMPTTCFMIAALWCFSRSSPALAQKLLDHPRFGPTLRQWRTHGVIPVQIKAIALTSMAASWGIVVMVSTTLLVPAVVGSILVAVAGFIVSRPSQPQPVAIVLRRGPDARLS